MPTRQKRPRGRVERVSVGPESPGLDRELAIYLPPSYGETERRYPVIYMQDGQNLFDPEASFAGSWRVDLAMNWAATRGLEGIVVAVPNTGDQRIAEYSPFDDPEGGPGRGGDYVSHLAGTIKPLVDARFRTLPQRETTGVAGSSMGGLISLFAFFARPDVVRRHGGVESVPVVRGARYLWTARPGTLFIRAGSTSTWAARREPRPSSMPAGSATCCLRRGTVQGVHLRYVEDRAGKHEEAAWGRRFRAALPFLLSSSE